MENKYIKEQFNGLTKEVYKWDCVSISPFFKEEFRNKTAEKEIADAYLHSAECLYMCLHRENNPDNGIKVFRMNQMCMPFLFLCRHTIELSIKWICKNVFKQKYLELLEKYKMELTELYIKAGYPYDHFFHRN